jgi:hypothetical protein
VEQLRCARETGGCSGPCAPMAAFASRVLTQAGARISGILFVPSRRSLCPTVHLCVRGRRRGGRGGSRQCGYKVKCICIARRCMDYTDTHTHTHTHTHHRHLHTTTITTITPSFCSLADGTPGPPPTPPQPGTSRLVLSSGAESDPAPIRQPSPRVRLIVVVMGKPRRVTTRTGARDTVGFSEIAMRPSSALWWGHRLP